MRTSFFNSLVFAMLTLSGTSVLATPAGVQDNAESLMVQNQVENKVDLNNADAATLQRELAGVGEAKAKAIVAYRDSNGPFSSIDELLEVKGIGKAILDKNRGRVVAN